MKKIRLILLLILTLSVVLVSFTSCDAVSEKFGDIKGYVSGIFGNDTDDDVTDDNADKVDPSTCGHYVTSIKNKVAATCTSEGYTGDSVCYSCGTVVKTGKAIAKTAHNIENGKCTVCGQDAPDDPFAETKAEWAKTYDCITISEALTLCEQFVSTPSTERYYIIATVKSVDDASFGQLTIEDGTGEIMVYGTYSADGEKKYSEMNVDLKAGDLILIYGTLQNYNGNTKEVQNARLIDHVAGNVVPPTVTINPDDYQLSSIADARLVKDGDIVKVKGVVARITYAFGMNPSGFYLVDGTGSIYVYDGDLAASVKIGNTVTLAGAKDHWILEDEKNNAQKFGYKGCNQITDAILVDNDNGNSDFDTSWIIESTMRDIINTPVTTDISSSIYKVNALVKKVVAESGGYTNYYFFDLDGETGAYAYTQCNGGDFTWLDQFDEKICTVYISALNAKSTSSDCYWRFIPVAVIDENYRFDLAGTPDFVLDYYVSNQFRSKYTADPALEVITSVSSALLGFEGATVTYISDNENVGKFTALDGKVIFNLVEYGTVTVTATATYGDYTASTSYTVTYEEPREYDYITVEDVLDAEFDTVVTVQGIVGPSLVNQTGFYLMGENGFIAVTMSADEIANIELGQLVILQGTKVRRVKTDDNGNPYDLHGQTHLKDCTVLLNLYGQHSYSTDSYSESLTIEQFKELDKTVDYTTSVFIIEAYIYVTQYNIKIGNADGSVQINLYSSGVGQYSWLKDYDGQALVLEIAPCNWNSKSPYAACVLSATLPDGTVVTTLSTLTLTNS